VVLGGGDLALAQQGVAEVIEDDADVGVLRAKAGEQDRVGALKRFQA